MAREGEVKLGVQQVRVTLITWKCTIEYFEDLIMKTMKIERRRKCRGLGQLGRGWRSSRNLHGVLFNSITFLLIQIRTAVASW